MGSDAGYGRHKEQHPNARGIHREVEPAVRTGKPQLSRRTARTRLSSRSKCTSMNELKLVNSTGPSSSDHDADVPMTDVFETRLRDLDTRRSFDGKGGRHCC